MYVLLPDKTNVLLLLWTDRIDSAMYYVMYCVHYTQYVCVCQMYVLYSSLFDLRAEMQVATTQDYATDSWFWTVFTGALNHQTTHHLFPGVLQSHYKKITPIVKKTCEEFGLKYNHVDTAAEAVECHINHLKVLGQATKKHPE